MASRFCAEAMHPPWLGSWVTIGAETVVDTLAVLGHDYIGIDCQHSMIDPSAACRLLHCIALDGLPTVVRASRLCGDQIGRFFDAGADAVIVPMIDTAEQAAEVVAATRYAPRGGRSLGPFRQGLGVDPRAIEDRAGCFVMIETSTALANLEAICATPGLAGIYVGPADLSVALGLPLVASPPPGELRAAMKRIADVARAAGLLAASHAYSAAHVPFLFEDGYQMMTLGVDRNMMAAAARAELAAARSAISATG